MLAFTKAKALKHESVPPRLGFAGLRRFSPPNSYWIVQSKMPDLT